MKRIFFILILLGVYSLLAFAQSSTALRLAWGTVTPSTCNNKTSPNFYNTATNVYSVCRGGVYVQVAPATGGGSGLTDPGANGWLVRTSLNTTTARAFGVGSNLTITNADGTGGNPTISLGANVTIKSGAVINNNCAKWNTDGTISDAGAPCSSGPAGLADPAANGWLVRTSLNTTIARAFGVGSNLTITNADGTGGNPTISLGANVAIKSGSTVTNNCTKWNSDGTIGDAGAPCSSGGGSGVTSLTGTSNQISFSASTGAVTASLPQDIATNSLVNFNRVTLTNSGAGALSFTANHSTGSFFNAYLANSTTGIVVNEFTGAGGVEERFNDSTAASDQRRFRIAVNNSRYYLQTLNDAGNAANSIYYVDRIGNTPTFIEFPTVQMRMGTNPYTNGQLLVRSNVANRPAARFDSATSSTVAAVVINSEIGGPTPIQTPNLNSSTADLGGTVKPLVVDGSGNFGVASALPAALTPLSGSSAFHYLPKFNGTMTTWQDGVQRFYRFQIEHPITLGAIQYELVTPDSGGGGAAFTLYQSNCSTQIIGTNSIALNQTAGAKRFVFGSTVTIQPGTYCLVYGSSNPNAFFRAIAPDANRYILDNATGSFDEMGSCGNPPNSDGTPPGGGCGTLTNGPVNVPVLKLRGN